MQESERQRALDAYAILDTPRESGFQEITQLVAELCDVPSATITFVDRDCTWMKAATGHGLAELPRARSFCGFAIEERGLTVIRDTALDPRCREIESAQADRPVRFYAGAPIVTPDGHTLGMLCVTDYHPRDLTP
ncbi:MAG TPA: GAF domain-containing protein, partial [Kofleriaceae bacterium]